MIQELPLLVCGKRSDRIEIAVDYEVRVRIKKPANILVTAPANGGPGAGRSWRSWFAAWRYKGLGGFGVRQVSANDPEFVTVVQAQHLKDRA